MVCKSAALPLRRTPYGDGHMIVRLFTLEFGKISCMAAAGRSAAGQARRRTLQPPGVLEVVFYRRPSRELQRLTDAAPLRVFPALWAEPLRMAYAFLAIETADALLPDERPEPELFDALLETLVCLEEGPQADLAAHALVFLADAARSAGVAPSGPTLAPRSATLELESGALLELTDDQPDALAGAFVAGGRAAFLAAAFHAADCRRGLRQGLRFLELHAAGFRTPESVRVYRELFA